MKLTKKQLSICKKYWKLRGQARCLFYTREMALEEKLNKELGLPFRVMFFSSETAECIVPENPKDRKHFPMLFETELAK